MNSFLYSDTLARDGFGLWLDVAVKGTTLLLAMGLVILLARRTSAAGRHLTWSLGLYGLLVLPVLCWAVPGWHVPLLPALADAGGNETTSADESRSVARMGNEVGLFHAKDDVRAKRQAGRESLIVLENHGEPAGTPPPAAAEPLATPDPVPWTTWVLTAWAIGAFLTLTPLLVGLVALWRLASQAQRITDRPWVILASEVSRELGLHRAVTLLRCFRGTMPMTWGLVRPVILLPADADDWPTPRRRLVLLHELAHVQRRDCLTQMLAQVACALYWFNPLVWLAARQLRRERERACDDQVLRAGSRASDYAYLLLETARSLRAGRCPSLATVAMAQRSQLEGRLLAVLDPRQPRQPLTRRRICMAVMAAATLVVPLAGLRPWALAEDRPAVTPRQSKSAAAAQPLIWIEGKVVTPNGQAAASAEVALLTFPKQWWLDRSEQNLHFDVLRQVQADGMGQFRFQVPRFEGPVPAILPVLPGQMMARGKGFGFGLASLELKSDQKGLVIKVMPEQVVRGRLVDLQGAPIQGLTVQCFAVMEMRGLQPVGAVRPAQKLKMWPGPLVTDSKGRFVVRGLGRRQRVALMIDDNRYAPQMLEMGGDQKGDPKEITRVLPPAQLIEGRVTCEDTGKPVAHAKVKMTNAETWTDQDGHFRLNPFVEQYAQGQLAVLPAQGQPYLGVYQMVSKAKAGARRKVDIKLPRGILVRGKVSEAVSGKPVTGAVVYFVSQPGLLRQPPRRDLALGSAYPVAAGSDGVFRIALPPGKGRLFAMAFAPDYIPVEIGANEMYSNQSGGARSYAHAIMPLDLKPKADPPEVEIKLRRGKAVKGSIVGAAGKPATGVRMVSRLSTSATLMGQEPYPVDLPDGGFQIRSCDPDKAYPVVFFAEKDRQGVMLSLSGKEAGKPLMVRLENCGQATVQFVDGDGKPLTGYQPEVDLLLVPGPHRYDFQKVQQRHKLAADAVSLRQLHRQYYQWGKDAADAQGRYRLPMLIPGVTYRIWRYGNGAEVLRDFTVKAGDKVDLGRITVK